MVAIKYPPSVISHKEFHSYNDIIFGSLIDLNTGMKKESKLLLVNCLITVVTVLLFAKSIDKTRFTTRFMKGLQQTGFYISLGYSIYVNSKVKCKLLWFQISNEFHEFSVSTIRHFDFKLRSFRFKSRPKYCRDIMTETQKRIGELRF